MSSETTILPEAQPHKKSLYYGYIIIICSFLILTIIFIAIDIFGVFFKPLIEEFHWSRTVISGASALNNLTFGIFCALTASLCQKFSLRLVISCLTVLLGLSYFLMSRIDTAWQLYLYYGILISLGTSSYITLLSVVARWFEQKRGLMTGVVFSGVSLAAAIGPPAANWLITISDWRTAFLILGIISVVVILPPTMFLRKGPSTEEQMASGNLFFNKDAKPAEGLELRQAMRTRQFWLLCGMYFVFLFCTVIVLVHIIIHAIGIGLSPAEAANVLAAYGIVCIITVNVMGFSGDKFGNRPTFALSYLLLAIAFFWLLGARETWQLYLFGIILGLSYGGMQVMFSPLVAELFGLKAHGVILGAVAIGGAIGAALGPLFAGYMFDMTNSYTLTFIVCAVLAIVALALTLLLGGWRKSAPKI